jgi:diguanylate cyclase (GGDEF)-like protein
MILDLDFFKNVNDEHGHLAGDAVLKMTAGTIKNTIRAYDLLARYGGEEFILMLTDPSESGVRALAERIRRNVEAAECRFLPERVIRVTCSLGVAKYYEGAALVDVTERADKALYTAKQSGRNKVCVWGD